MSLREIANQLREQNAKRTQLIEELIEATKAEKCTHILDITPNGTWVLVERATGTIVLCDKRYQVRKYIRRHKLTVHVRKVS